MGIKTIPSSVDIAISGLRAEATRMNVTSSNIANSKTTNTPTGDPYRRKVVQLTTGGDELSGPVIKSIAPDMIKPFPVLHQPGHPDADKDGNVRMPNVDLPIEMIDLVTASRAYQANTAVMKRHGEIMDAAIALLK